MFGFCDFDLMLMSYVYVEQGEYVIWLMIDFCVEYCFGLSVFVLVVGFFNLLVNELCVIVMGVKMVFVD